MALLIESIFFAWQLAILGIAMITLHVWLNFMSLISTCLHLVIADSQADIRWWQTIYEFFDEIERTVPIFSEYDFFFHFFFTSRRTYVTR